MHESSKPIAVDGTVERLYRPVIGIVTTQVPTETIQRINCRYLHSVVEAGGIPLLIPILPDLSVIDRLLALVDGVLLTGGQDLVPATYGEELSGDPAVAATVESTPVRDPEERHLLDVICERDLPCAGIYRGMQMMNAYFGGTLYQDLDHEFIGHDARPLPEPIKHRQPLDAGGNRVHGVRIGNGTLLADVFGAGRLPVNSLHHQGIRVLGEGLTASGISDDGLIEGIENHAYRYMVAVQWHPEYFGRAGAPMHRYFSMLVDEARLYHLEHAGA